VAPLLRNARKHHIRHLAQEIHNAASCLSACRAEICKKVGLNAQHWRALGAIDRSTFVLSISDLARRLRRSRQSVHPLALGLERAGWIRFLPNQDDRRLLQMEITGLGKSILSAAEDRYNNWLLTMASDLGDHELRDLTHTLRAVRERIARARDYA
jgi:DNA-binding MarR family transcriptional regulator